MPDVPCVSLDQVRLQLGVSPEDNQGQVIQEGFEQARVHLRARRDFVWNATNVTRSNREKVTRLARDYGARIRIVYLEVAPDVLLDQNGRREAAVPPAAIARLARKLEPPHASEAHEVVWISDGEKVFGTGTQPAAAQPSP
jgi:predicted kinase